MDAVDFLKSRKEMCNKMFKDGKACTRCVACGGGGTFCIAYTGDENRFDEAVKIVEAWVKNNPKKTRLQDFIEKFPNVKMNDYGFPKDMCCMTLGYCDECKYFGSVESKCQRCWNEPVED